MTHKIQQKQTTAQETTNKNNSNNYKISVSYKEIEDITFFYLMSYNNWLDLADKQTDKEKRASYYRIADKEREQFKRF